MGQVIAIVFLLTWLGWSVWFLRSGLCPRPGPGDYLASVCIGILHAAATFSTLALWLYLSRKR